MSKLDQLLKATGANIDKSMGAGRESRPLHGAATPGASPASARMAGVARSKDAAEIPVDRIVPDPDQPRDEFDPEALERLAHSLRTRGQLQPIRVRWDDARGNYVLIAGERRWRAARLAGLATLSCVIAEAPADPGELLAVQLIENCVREDLTPMEQARAYRAVMQAKGWSARHLAAELGINPATVSRAMALLDLPDSVRDQVERGELSPATAYEVSKVEDPALREQLADAAVDGGLNRSEVAELVQAVKARRPLPGARPDPVTLDLGDGIVVSVRYRKPSSVLPVQALRRATRLLQDRERGDEAA